VAASALVEGLQTHNAGEVSAAAEQLAANAADVGSNNLMADGGNYAGVIAAAEATAVTPAADQGSASGTPQDPGAGGTAQGSGAGGSTQGTGAGGSAQGSGSGGSAQGSGAGGAQAPGNDGDHGNGQGSSLLHHHQSLNQNLADFSPQQGANRPSA